MKNLNKYLAVAVMVGAATGVSAQALNSGYFLDGYLFKHQLNPALESDKAYFSIPVLGNINIGTRGNIGLGNFLYPTANGGLTTFGYVHTVGRIQSMGWFQHYRYRTEIAYIGKHS